MQNIIDNLNKTLFRSHLSDDQLAALAAVGKTETFADGTFIIKEGEQGDAFYIIINGKVSVTKNHQEAEDDFTLRTLHAGDYFGEMVLLDQDERTANICAKGEVQLLKITFTDFKRFAEQHQIWTSIHNILVKTLVSRIISTNELATNVLYEKYQGEKLRNSMAKFIGCIIIALTFFSFVNPAMSYLVKTSNSSSFATLFMLTVFIVGYAVVLSRSEYALADFGFNLNRAGHGFIDAIIYSIPLMLIILLLKYYMINTHPDFAHYPLFGFSDKMKFLSQHDTVQESQIPFVGYILLYCLSAAIQEIMCRGALQSPLQRFFVNKYSKWLAIFYSNLLFAASHLHLSIFFAGISFFPGLFWGWLYSRYNSLFPCIVSHIIIGIWALFIVSIQSVLFLH